MKIEVTQDDREAAAEYYYASGGTRQIAQQIRDGQKDDWFRVIFFARHRISADAEPREGPTYQQLLEYVEGLALAGCATAIGLIQGKSL